MGAGRVAVVATWQGWCGGCADERPLVLTRSGRRTLRSWWAGIGDDHLALTLTCRLCGLAVDVPLHEEDDVDPVEAGTDLRSVEDLVEVTVVAEPVGAATVVRAVEEPAEVTDRHVVRAAVEQPAAAPAPDATDAPEPDVAGEQPVAPSQILSQARAALTARRIAAEQAAAQAIPAARSAEDADQQQEGRQAVAAALAALVTQRSAANTYPEDVTSEQALQLLADGVDALPAAAAG